LALDLKFYVDAPVTIKYETASPSRRRNSGKKRGTLLSQGHRATFHEVCDMEYNHNPIKKLDADKSEKKIFRTFKFCDHCERTFVEIYTHCIYCDALLRSFEVEMRD
jgi:hypothetical protein